MCKIILSALVDDLRGKLAGSVVQGTVGGLQLRTRVSPRNPRSLRQQTVRSDFAYMIRTWPLLTSGQRSSWSDANDLPESGVYRYQVANSYIYLTGNPLLAEYTGSGLLAEPELGVNTLSQADQILESIGYGGNIPADTYILYFATPPLSPATTFISPSDPRFISAQGPGSYINDNWDISIPYQARFGVPPELAIIGFKAVVINVATGDYSIVNYINEPVINP